MLIGEGRGIRVYAIDAGDVRLDGGSMFGVVPRTMWARHIEPDGSTKRLKRGRDRRHLSRDDRFVFRPLPPAISGFRRFFIGNQLLPSNQFEKPRVSPDLLAAADGMRYS